MADPTTHYPACWTQPGHHKCAQDRVRELLSACGSAALALRSYQYGNQSPDLAEEVAKAVDKAILRAKEPGHG